MDYSDYRELKFRRVEPGILEIVMGEEGKLSFATARMHAEMAKVWLDVDRDPETRVAILRGAGKGFSAGGGIRLSVFDGELNAILVSGGGILSQFWRARRLAVRPLAAARGLWRGRVTSARITGDRLGCHVDGETFETSGEVAVELTPGAIRVAAGTG